jgi:hypothetical protein
VRHSIPDTLALSSRRRNPFIDDNLLKYQEALKMADERMEEAIKNMRVGVCE